MEDDQGPGPRRARWSPSAGGVGNLGMAVCNDLGDTAPAVGILAAGARPLPVRCASGRADETDFGYINSADGGCSSTGLKSLPERGISSVAEVNFAYGDTEPGTALPARSFRRDTPGQLARLTSLAKLGGRRNRRLFEVIESPSHASSRLACTMNTVDVSYHVCVFLGLCLRLLVHLPHLMFCLHLHLLLLLLMPGYMACMVMSHLCKMSLIHFRLSRGLRATTWTRL